MGNDPAILCHRAMQRIMTYNLPTPCKAHAFCPRFVRVRAPTNVQQPASTFVQAAARARCLAQSAVDEQIYLHLSSGGHVTALEYRVGCPDQPSKLPAEWSQPQQIPVVWRFPCLRQERHAAAIDPGLVAGHAHDIADAHGYRTAK